MAPPLVRKAAGRIQKETSACLNVKKANIEYQIMNVECRRNEFCQLYL